MALQLCHGVRQRSIKEAGPKMQERLYTQLGFLLEADKLKSVVRMNYLADGSRRENDAEHSWHMAVMIAIMASYFPDADALKSIRMALIHDLVEIDAGDVFAFDEYSAAEKRLLEEKAAKRIFSLLPDDQQQEYLALWKEFEAGETSEALLANVVDRLQPLMLHRANSGLMWREYGVTLEKLTKRNEITLQRAPREVASFVRDLIEEAAVSGYLAPGDTKDMSSAPGEVHIREMTMEDYEEAYMIWTETPGVGMRSLDDSLAGIQKFLRRNPRTCFVAQVGGRLQGVIMAGHDGRRGYIYHAVVRPAMRGKGIGRSLVDAACLALCREGINKVALVVFRSNDPGNAFWEKLGWERRQDLNYFNLSLNRDNY
jgi:putative hydrolases of HD superfamily